MRGFVKTETRRVWLPEHATLPMDQRPMLLCRPLTAQEYSAKCDAVKASAALANDSAPGETAAQVVTLLDGVVVGWENVRNDDGSAIPFDLRQLAGLTEFGQLMLLFWRAIDSRFDLGADVEKNSASPQCSGGEKCAGAARPGSATTGQPS